MLPATPEPAGTAVAAGGEPARNVRVLPLTVMVSPSAGCALPTRAVAELAVAAISLIVPLSAAVPSPAVAAEPTSDDEMPPSSDAGAVLCTGVAPPAAPEYSTLLLAMVLM